MKTAPAPPVAGLGQPSYVWRFGLERRLSLIRHYVPLEGRRMLDIGCGVGTFVRRLAEFSAYVYGVDIDRQRVRRGAQALTPAPSGGLAVAVSENLPFRDAAFDLVLLHEVLEHVRDDALTLREACRVTRPGGNIVIFCPNRLYPFETHGVFLGKRYIFGNIPLVNYLPDPWRRRLVPHVRAYTGGGLRRLLARLPARIVVHTCVWPGFDNLSARSGFASAVLRRVLYPLEGTPLRIFGLSHFVILEKKD
ncbi:MAG: class I SAM-dependent methyltransferase [Armatimonadota bacterium]|nr:class I SAM-dependent methyltransferase [Armatimonadota bacterium]